MLPERDPSAFQTLLPAAALRFELADNMFLRAAYGMTVTRPESRQLAPFIYYDFVRNRNITGNPDLARTLIQNVDLRWEWFFSQGELIALSAFYKYFDQPVELQVQNSAYDALFINAHAAHNVGGELEVRVSLSHLHEALSMFQVGGNVTVMWSEVDLGDVSRTQSSRRLFGQAPYVATAYLRAADDDVGLSGTLSYSVVGPRITDVGILVGDRYFPDVERLPFHDLTFVGEYRPIPQFSVKLKVRNILFQTQDYAQGNLIVEQVDPGMSVSLGKEGRY